MSVQEEQIVTVSSCHLCGSSSNHILYEQNEHEILKCSECEFVWVSPILDINSLKNLYSKNYWNSNHPKDVGYADYFGDSKLYLKTFKKRFELIKQFAVTPGVALEIGSAAGYFLKVLEQNGWQTHGVELSASAAEFSRKTFELQNIQNCTFENAIFDQKFDLIALWDAIEHIPDPISTLKKSAKLLSANGHLIIETQNIESRFAKLLGPRWHHFKNREHLYHFSEKTLTNALEQANLEPIHITSKTAGKHITFDFLIERSTKLHPLMKYIMFPFYLIKNLSLYLNFSDEMIVIAKHKT